MTKGLPNYSPHQTAAVSQLILTASVYIMHMQGTKKPLKKLFFLKVKRSYFHPGLSFPLVQAAVLLKPNYSTEMTVECTSADQFI